MEKVQVFYLEQCPYCRHAKKAIEELRGEMPELAGIELEWIEESRCPEIAAQYDYYYVPTLFYGRKKLYEASPSDGYREIKNHLEEAFRAVSGEN